jgi:hypothetical protein
VLGVLAQALQAFLAPVSLPAQPPGPVLEGKAVNLIVNSDLAALQAWNPQDGANVWAKLQPDGFWRLPQSNPRTGFANQEIYLARFYPIAVGRTYTQSFYLRTDHDLSNPQISFFTARGHYRVPLKVIWANHETQRLAASYQAQPEDNWLRPLDLTGFQNERADLELGFAQLEQGSGATAFVHTPKPRVPWNVPVVYWLGSAGLMVGLIATGYFLGQTGVGFGFPLVFGLVIQVVLALFLKDSTEGHRAVGVLGVPNLFGHNAALLGLLTVSLASPMLAGLGLLLASLNVWLSGSRAAFLILPISLMVLLVKVRSQVHRYTVVVFTALALLIVLALLFSGSFANRLGIDPSSLARLDIWGVAWQAFLDRPFGWGPQSFSDYYVLHRPVDVFDPNVSHPHNLPLGLLVEFGFLGFAGWLILLLTITGDLIRRNLQPTPQNVTSLGLVLMLAAALLMNMFDYTWLSAAVSGPLYTALGIWLSQNRSVQVAIQPE